LEFKPENQWVLSQLAYCIGMQKHHEEALKILLKLEEDGYQSAWMMAIIGYNYQELKNRKNALLYYQKAKEMGYQDEWMLDSIKKLEKRKLLF